MTMIRVRALDKVGRFNMHGITCEKTFIELDLATLSNAGLAALKLHRGINLEVNQDDVAKFDSYDGSGRDLALYAAQLHMLRADKFAAVRIAEEAAHQADYDYQDAIDALEAQRNKPPAVVVDGVAVEDLADDADDEAAAPDLIDDAADALRDAAAPLADDAATAIVYAAVGGSAVPADSETLDSIDAATQLAINAAIEKSGKKNKGK